AAPAPAPEPPPTGPVAKPLDHALARPDMIATSAPLPGFTKGLNLGNCLDAPAEGAWGTVISEKHFEMAQAAGFDHVRLPARFSAPERTDEKPPYKVKEEFFKRVDWAIDQALAHHLSVMLDMHYYDELMKDPNAHKARFYAIWKQIAERYAKRPPEVAFEILNEPNGKLEPKVLNEITKESIRIIRAKNPQRLIFADSYFWADAKRLAELELPKDENVVAQFHMYQPILFTHQGAPWMEPQYQTRGVIFPGPPATPLTPLPGAAKEGWVAEWFKGYNTLPAAQNPGGPQAVFDYFDFAAKYVKATGKRVYLGEFGAIENADPQSRENYVWLVRTEAERRGIGWAYWDDGGMFKIMNPFGGTWNEGLRKALLDK
ncbi:MAG TPA: glycoside hydrolase family 5 protein, partial [Polyangiaceae bacterium]|nr:glycoside hydrolase family 5 protein [Polyangiaceae bacterium]